MNVTKAGTTTWKDRIVGEGHEAPAELKRCSHPLNWREHSDQQRATLGSVLDQVGWVQRVIKNRQTGNLIDGHLRVDMALQQGEEAVPVVYVELTEEEERLVLATFDPISALAQSNSERLGDLLRNIQPQNGELDEFLKTLAVNNGVTPPSFGEQNEDGQGRIDQTKTITCPECGHEFSS